MKQRIRIAYSTLLVLSVLIAISIRATAQISSNSSMGSTAKALAGAFNQANQKQKSREQVYNQASKTVDPKKRLDELSKIILDYPDADEMFLYRINLDILKAMLQATPDDKEKILGQAQMLITKFSGITDASCKVPATFLEVGIMLDEALDISKKQLSELEKKEAENKSSTTIPEGKRTVMAMVLPMLHTRLISTIGLIYIKKGNIPEAEKALLESYKRDPFIPETPAALAEIALKSGNEKAALEFLGGVIITGRYFPEDRKKLEELYQKTHNNSLEGIEALLDDIYRQKAPSPLIIKPFDSSKKKSNRAVLAELFTGSSCPPCVGVDVAFEGIMERYIPKDVIVIVYHQHIPAPDPMANEVTLTRYKYYSGNGVPTYAIDGTKNLGGGSRETSRMYFERINQMTEKQLEVPAQADLNLEAVLDGSNVKVAVKAQSVQQGNLVLQIALVEDSIHYSGTNGIRFHPMVVRSLAKAQPENKDYGFTIDPSKPASVEFAFNVPEIEKALKSQLDEIEAKRAGLVPASNRPVFYEKKYQIDSSNLSVVVFLQDVKSNNILQAAYVKVKPAQPVSIK